MSERFNIEKLPDNDQRQIKRGRCPWDGSTLVDTGQDGWGDQCCECGDVFYGKLTIED